MHSRIFQVSENPVPVDERISEDRYYDGFVGSHADYVVTVEYQSDDYRDDLRWIREANNGIKVDIPNGTITVTSKKEYFDKKHDTFKELASELADITLEDFTSGRQRFKMHDLTSAYDNKYGFYIDDYDEYAGLTTLDDWVRSVEENKVYYVGSIFDYHF